MELGRGRGGFAQDKGVGIIMEPDGEDPQTGAGLDPFILQGEIVEILKTARDQLVGKGFEDRVLFGHGDLEQLAGQYVRAQMTGRADPGLDVEHAMLLMLRLFITRFEGLPPPYTSYHEMQAKAEAEAQHASMALVETAIANACAATSGKAKARLRRNLLAQGVPPALIKIAGDYSWGER
jgi:hypothetical protein